jgi:fatty acid desaturase
MAAQARPTAIDASPAPHELVPLHRVETWRSLVNVVADWALIAAAAALSAAYWHPLSYALAVVWIGSRQHALFLLAHEAVHGTLLRSRPWNDRLGELLCAWPVLVPYHSYRRVHLLHHRHLNTERDPDWARNRPDRLRASGSVLQTARVLLGLGGGQSTLFRFFLLGDGERPRDGEAPRPRVAYRLAFYAAVLGTAAWAGGLRLLLLYWLVPLGTWFLVAMRLKGTAEHFGVPDAGPPRASRTVLTGPVAAALIAPKSVGYHGAHHLYPGVPHYNLRRLHRRLMESERFRGEVHLTPGYLAFLGECFRLRSPRTAEGGEASAP